MTNAYNESYLNDAMYILGEMFDYAVYDCRLDSSMFYDVFISSPICSQFEKGNPKYVAGKSGVELARDVWKQMTGEMLSVEYSMRLDRSKHYWAGWVLAYYQWFRNISFLQMKQCGLDLNKTVSMYLLHEADISKFVSAADRIVFESKPSPGDTLKRLRTYQNLTQKKLSEKSEVTLRMVQLYEQGQNDLTKAQASVVCQLAYALKCSVSDLLSF